MAGHPASDRIRSLDGLRAASITLVILSHLVGTDGFPIRAITHIDLGVVGVRIFFVISGFLITSLLLKERDATGQVDVRAFIVRRTVRIFPAYYAFLAVVGVAGVLGVAGLAELTRGDFLHAITYTTNYYPEQHWALGHAWSLSVEEQFYLTWPFLVGYLGRRGAPRLAFLVLVLAPAARVLYLALPDGTTPLQLSAGESFETVADTIATGALLALFRDRLWAVPWYRRLLESRWVGLVPVVGFASATLDSWHDYVPFRVDWVLTAFHAAAGLTVLNVCIAVVIDWAVRFPDRSVGRLLNHRWLVLVGTLSYSLYLWQQPFLNPQAHGWHTHFPQSLILALAFATISYTLVERPALRLRDRLMHPPSPVR